MWIKYQALVALKNNKNYFKLSSAADMMSALIINCCIVVSLHWNEEFSFQKWILVLDEAKGVVFENLIPTLFFYN